MDLIPYNGNLPEEVILLIHSSPLMWKHFGVKLFQYLAPIQVPQHALQSMLAQQQVISTGKIYYQKDKEKIAFEQ